MSNRKLLKFVLPFFFCLFSVLQAEEMNLAEYLSRVEAENPDIALSGQDVATASESIKQARSALLPAVGLSADYVRNLSDIMQSAPVAAPAGGGQLIYQDVDSNMDNELTLAAGVSQTIFDPVAIARYAQAIRNRQIRGNVDNFTRKNILTAAKKLYARTQLAFSLLTVQEELEATSRDVYENIERKYKAGVTTELDLRMAEVDWKTAISSTAESRKNSALAMLALKQLAGIDPDKEIVLVENVGDLPELPQYGSFDSVLSSRDDFQAQLVAREIAEIAHKAALSSYLPSVTGRLSYALGKYGNETSFDAYDFTSVQLGVTVSLPVYTGGYRTSLVKTAAINKETAALQIMKKRNEIEQELFSLNLQMQEARKRIDTARLLQDVTERAYTLSRAALSNGLGTQLAVSQAGNNLAQASINLQYAFYNYQALYYDWELATGK